MSKIRKTRTTEMAPCVEDNDLVSSEDEQDTNRYINESFIIKSGAENIS